MEPDRDKHDILIEKLELCDAEIRFFEYLLSAPNLTYEQRAHLQERFEREEKVLLRLAEDIDGTEFLD